MKVICSIISNHVVQKKKKKPGGGGGHCYGGCTRCARITLKNGDLLVYQKAP